MGMTRQNRHKTENTVGGVHQEAGEELAVQYEECSSHLAFRAYLQPCCVVRMHFCLHHAEECRHSSPVIILAPWKH